MKGGRADIRPDAVPGPGGVATLGVMLTMRPRPRHGRTVPPVAAALRSAPVGEPAPAIDAQGYRRGAEEGSWSETTNKNSINVRVMTGYSSPAEMRTCVVVCLSPIGIRFSRQSGAWSLCQTEPNQTPGGGQRRPAWTKHRMVAEQ